MQDVVLKESFWSVSSSGFFQNHTGSARREDGIGKDVQKELEVKKGLCVFTKVQSQYQGNSLILLKLLLSCSVVPLLQCPETQQSPLRDNGEENE